MATDYFNNLKHNGSFLNDCVSLYGITTDEITARYANLLNTFEMSFGYEGQYLFSSPGRIELVGNHTDHNGGTYNLQLAFANMLSGYDTNQFTPTKVSGGFGTYPLTGLNRRTNATVGEDNIKYYVECEAIIPLDGGDEQALRNMLQGYTYTIQGERPDGTAVPLATFRSNMSNEDVENIIAQGNAKYDGLQLNVRWKMYLEVDE